MPIGFVLLLAPVNCPKITGETPQIMGSASPVWGRPGEASLGSISHLPIQLYTPTQVFLDALRVVNRAYSRLDLAVTFLQEAPVRAAMGCPLSV